MAEFLQEYLKLGLSQIVVIDHRHKEERSGYQNEYTQETIVAYDGHRFVRVEASESKVFAPPGRHELSLTQPEEITEAQYNELSEGRVRSDTPAVLQSIKDREIASQQQTEASAQLKARAPNCPKCGRKLTTRKGPHGRFWGCSSYPNCKGTAEFTAEDRRLYEIASRFV